MKLGQWLHGYRITSDQSNDNAGKCVWAFAEKDGQEYFVKEFLEPKRPRPESMGSPETKRILLAQCTDFERRHQAVMARVDPTDLHAGNLVVAVDFFCEGTRYYKVTERLYSAEGVAPHRMTPRDQVVLLGTLADSLQFLHGLGVVHNDLKPSNILLYRPPDSALHIAKLIDFDDSYVTGEPPPRTELGGDPSYAAPEWLRYSHGDPDTGPDQLTVAADVFAFGLLLHCYLTGALPRYDARYDCVAAAVNAGAPVDLDPRLSGAVMDAVARMLAGVPAARPTVQEMQPLLTADSLRLAGHAPAPARSGRLRINVGSGNPREPDPGPDRGRPRSRLRINLDGRSGDGRPATC